MRTWYLFTGLFLGSILNDSGDNGNLQILAIPFPITPAPISCVSYSAAAAALDASWTIRQRSVVFLRVDWGQVTKSQGACMCFYAWGMGLPSFYHYHSPLCCTKGRTVDSGVRQSGYRNATLLLTSCVPWANLLSSFLCLSLLICKVWTIITILTLYCC